MMKTNFKAPKILEITQGVDRMRVVAVGIQIFSEPIIK
jgi:hypothetical protein